MASYLPTPCGNVVSTHSDFAIVYSVDEAEHLLAIYRSRNLSGRRALEIAVEKAKATLADRRATVAAHLATFSGPCRNWPAQVAGLSSDEIEAALAARKLEQA